MCRAKVKSTHCIGYIASLNGNGHQLKQPRPLFLTTLALGALIIVCKWKEIVLTVNARTVGGAVDSAIGHELKITILEEHLYGARRASDVAEIRGALRARLGCGGSGARGQRQRRQKQPQRARARRHGAPRPWQPPGRRHCTTPPRIPRTTTLIHPSAVRRKQSTQGAKMLAPNVGLFN